VCAASDDGEVCLREVGEHGVAHERVATRQHRPTRNGGPHARIEPPVRDRRTSCGISECAILTHLRAPSILYPDDLENERSPSPSTHSLDTGSSHVAPGHVRPHTDAAVRPEDHLNPRQAPLSGDDAGP